MLKADFNNFETALWFLRKISVGMIQRQSAPHGIVYRWSSEGVHLDEYQLGMFNEISGRTSKWSDEDTGLTWLLHARHFPSFFEKDDIEVAGHSDWRVPTLTELKTLSGINEDAFGAHVKPALVGRVKGAYACSAPQERKTDGQMWNFNKNQFSEVHHREGKIKWGSEGEYAGFEADRWGVEGERIFVRGQRTDIVSDWVQSLISWAHGCRNYDFPVTEENILALTSLTLEDDNIPEHFGKLKNLRTVIFHNCLHLPSELFELKHLASLEWDHGCYSHSDKPCTLPAEIGNLTSLTALKIERRNLSGIPCTIGALANLKSLYIVGGNLGRLPETIGALHQLEELSLIRNNLESLPSSIDGWTSLRHLTVINESMRQGVPAELWRLTQLESMVLDSTPLGTLPAALANFKCLQNLSLRRCDLCGFSESLLLLDGLQKLDVSFNLIASLPEEIYELGQLTHLGIAATLLSPQQSMHS